MNVNDIAYMYNSAINNTQTGSVTSASSIAAGAAKEALQKAGVTNFSESLGDEISKLNLNSQTSTAVNASKSLSDSLTDVERLKAAEFKELAGALDHSVLGNMIEGATDKDLALMSEEMLGSSKGREVLSKLMEGHFNNIVLSDSDDDNESKAFDQAADTFSDTVTRTQDLGKIADTVQPTDVEEE